MGHKVGDRPDRGVVRSSPNIHRYIRLYLYLDEAYICIATMQVAILYLEYM
jgi:hypothetical protein